MVGQEGLEPSRPYGQQILSLVCLPIPPLPLVVSLVVLVAFVSFLLLA